MDTVIEGHGDVNTWAGFRDYAQFNRALLDAAKAGLGKQTPEEIAAEPEAEVPGVHEGGTADGHGVRRHAAVARGDQRERRVPGAEGEPVTTNFGPPRARPPAAERGSVANHRAAGIGRAWAVLRQRFLNVTGMPPWALFTVPVMDVPSAESSPANVHGCVLGNSKFIRRSFIVKSRSGLSIVGATLPRKVFRLVPISFPCTVPSAFLVNSRKMS